jgi:hypothetical protein
LYVTVALLFWCQRIAPHPLQTQARFQQTLECFLHFAVHAGCDFVRIRSP